MTAKQTALIQELAHTAASRTGTNLMAQDPKFVAALAELIVAECADIDFRFKVGLTSDHDYEISNTIKQHFGVE